LDNKDKAAPVGGRLIGALVGVFLVSAAVAAGFYLLHFRGLPIVADPEPWGRLGDFLGGVLGPLVGLLLLIGLVWSMLSIRSELALTRAALQRTAEALPRAGRPPEGAEDADGREDLYRTLEVIHEDLRQQLAVRIRVSRTPEGVSLGERAPAGPPDGDAREVSLEQLLRECVQDPVLRESVAAGLKGGLTPLAELLQHLARYVHEYESLPAGRGAASYFRRRHALSAVALHKLGLLPERVAVFFREARNGRSASGNGEARRPESGSAPQRSSATA
jgi:hypothetical protein